MLEIDVLNNLASLSSLVYFLLVGIISALSKYIFFEFPIVKPSFINISALYPSNIRKAIFSLGKVKDNIAKLELATPMVMGGSEAPKLGFTSLSMDNEQENSLSTPVQTNGINGSLSETSSQEDNPQDTRPGLLEREENQANPSSSPCSPSSPSSSSSSDWEESDKGDTPCNSDSGSDTSEVPTEAIPTDAVKPFANDGTTGSINLVFNLTETDIRERLNKPEIKRVFRNLDTEEIKTLAPYISDNVETEVEDNVKNQISAVHARDWQPHLRQRAADHLDNITSTGVDKIRKDVFNQANKVLRERGSTTVLDHTAPTPESPDEVNSDEENSNGVNSNRVNSNGVNSNSNGVNSNGQNSNSNGVNSNSGGANSGVENSNSDGVNSGGQNSGVENSNSGGVNSGGQNSNSDGVNSNSGGQNSGV